MANKYKTVDERQEKDKQVLIETFKDMPIVQVACKRAGVSRATYYRWRDEDDKFRKLAESAIIEGEALITDMSESQLISLIKERKFPAVHLWLRHHHPKYGDKIQIVNSTSEPDTLNAEQKAVIKQALRLSKITNLKTKYESKKSK